jgi:hypothetical protein
MVMLNGFVRGELERCGWKSYEGAHPLPKNTFVRDGVLLSLSLLKSNGMYHVSVQTMSKVDVRLVSQQEMLGVIKNGKWSK